MSKLQRRTGRKKCFLPEYYNNCDVDFFVQGVNIQREFWRGLGICMICDGISLSGLAMRIFDKHLAPDTYIALPARSDYRFARTLRKSIVNNYIRLHVYFFCLRLQYGTTFSSVFQCGGLAQVFHRVHIAGVTRLKGSDRLCETIEGYDFNSLYLTELGMPMPLGVPFEWRRPSEDDRPFRGRTRVSGDDQTFQRRPVLPASVSLAELEWLSWESWRRQIRIRHYLSCRRQLRVGESRYRVDGAALPNLLFEFHGTPDFKHNKGNSSLAIYTYVFRLPMARARIRGSLVPPIY